MSEEKFNVVFRGQIRKNFELHDVKQNLAQLFKSTPQAIENLFTGAEVTIRKSLDYPQAMKYQAALKNAGALALIQQAEEQPPTQQPAQQPSAEQPSENQQTANSQSESALSNSESKSKPKTEPEPQAEQVSDTDAFSVAPVGEQILPPKVYEKRQVDTSKLSMGEPGEKILPPQEKKKYPQPSIDHLSLEEKSDD